MIRLVGLAHALKFELLWSLRRPEIEVVIPGFRNSFLIRRYSSDRVVFSSVFLEGELEGYLPEGPGFILDGGANVGFTTAFYAHHYPSSTIIAVEPSGSNVIQFRRNCSGYGNVTLLEGALWSSSVTTVKIANPDDESWSFHVEASDGPGGIRAFTIPEILDKFAVGDLDLLKLDIEGAERQLFEAGSDQWLPRVKAIIVEIHGDEARLAIEKACNQDEFLYSRKGEKVYAVRRRGVPLDRE